MDEIQIPKIKMVYAPTYDEAHYHSLKRIFDRLNIKPDIDLDFNREDKKRHGKTYAKKLQEKWDSRSHDFLKVMSEVSGLPWRESSVICYLMSYRYLGGFSDPLTLRMYDKIDSDMTRTIDTLIHEMAHRLRKQNKDKINENGPIFSKYSSEPRIVRRHMHVFAILKLLYGKLYGPEKWEEIKERERNHPNYWRATEIVEKEGAENLILDLTTF